MVGYGRLLSTCFQNDKRQTDSNQRKIASRAKRLNHWTRIACEAHNFKGIRTGPSSNVIKFSLEVADYFLTK